MKRKAFAKTMSLIMCVLMMISTISIVNVSAVEVFTSKDGKWKCMTLENGEASIIKYLGKATTVTLPEEIDGYKMTYVDLSGNESGVIKYLTVPKSYTGVYAAENNSIVSVTFSRDYTEPVVELDQCGSFYKCKKLKKVILPNMIANDCSEYGYTYTSGGYLPDNTFYNCKQLEKVVLPDNIVEIGGSCFYNCKSIKDLVIPDGVNKIGIYAVEGCTGMVSITLPESLKNWHGYGVADNCRIVSPPDTYISDYVEENKEHFQWISSEPSKTLGDVNGDEVLNITDVTIIQKKLVEIYTFDITNFDANADGKFTISDATAIQRTIAKIEN